MKRFLVLLVFCTSFSSVFAQKQNLTYLSAAFQSTKVINYGVGYERQIFPKWTLGVEGFYSKRDFIVSNFGNAEDFTIFAQTQHRAMGQQLALIFYPQKAFLGFFVGLTSGISKSQDKYILRDSWNGQNIFYRCGNDLIPSYFTYTDFSEFTETRWNALSQLKTGWQFSGEHFSMGILGSVGFSSKIGVSDKLNTTYEVGLKTGYRF